LQERHKNAFLQGDGRTGEFEPPAHNRKIVVITTNVKRKESRLRKADRPMASAAAEGESRSGNFVDLA